ncbi:tail protein [Bacillus phage Silence]|nr:tail protein [Bacillus phage Silence]
MRGKLKTALLPMQIAVFQRLENDIVLKGMVNGVFDEVPEGTPLPFVKIGDDTVNPFDTKTSYGEEATLTLLVYDNGPGKTNAKRIMDVVLQAMSAEPLVLTGGFTVDSVEREFLEVTSDGVVTQGVCRFRINIRQI